MRHEIFQFIDQSADILHRNNRIYESPRIGWTDSFPIAFVEGFVSECSHAD